MSIGLSRLEPPLRSPRRPGGRFVNYARTVESSPASWLSPATEDEVSKHVGDAAAAGRRIRVVGAGHSWSPIAAPEDIAVTLDRLNGVVSLGPGSVRVRAGTRLRHLYRALEASGRTLPIVASIAQQSVAGAIATGTHGSSLTHGNLSSLVIGARIVTGDGSVLEIDEDDERIDAARVHLGALGVVTEVTLRTEPTFRLAETVEVVPVDQVAGQVEAIGRSAEYAKVWWMPHTPDALVFRYTRTAEPVSRAPSPSTQRFVENWIQRAIVPAVYAWHDRRDATVPAFNRIATHWLAKDRRVGPSTLMLTTPEPVRHHETEAAVAVAAGSEAFDRVLGLIRRSDLRINFILELRYVRRDSAWMSTAHGGDVVHLSACTGVTGRRADYFDAFWAEMRPLGGRPHWAKEMDHDAEELRRLYPMTGRFAALRHDLDPGRVFANAFLERILGP